jgi:hypothetical protein
MSGEACSRWAYCFRLLRSACWTKICNNGTVTVTLSRSHFHGHTFTVTLSRSHFHGHTFILLSRSRFYGHTFTVTLSSCFHGHTFTVTLSRSHFRPAFTVTLAQSEWRYVVVYVCMHASACLSTMICISRHGAFCIQNREYSTACECIQNDSMTCP